ncbi:hypothetical protein RhiirC2_857615 [Rhizophagus irregularis]|uniref:Uncharacterized protein n=1 Tax=Rhizophagus irregularis TaxID=588596 RepID=A0A2N1MB04_9GLOM|nr:hypothetical protein RhiirC2_857615 [Rhizophagus irregularis]
MKLKNKANKVQFNTAHELLNNPHLNPKTSKDINIKNAISFYQNKSRVQNTEKATKNWLEAFEKFRKDMNESYPQDEQHTSNDQKQAKKWLELHKLFANLYKLFTNSIG